MAQLKGNRSAENRSPENRLPETRSKKNQMRRNQITRNQMRRNQNIRKQISSAAGSCFRRASLTVEAALTLPFFFLCFAALIFSLNFYADYARKAVSLQQAAEQTAEAAAGVSGVFSKEAADGTSAGDIIDLPGWVSLRLPFGLPVQIPSVRAVCRGRVHAWIGYTGSRDEAEDDGDRLVYVTDHGSVYHTSSDCTHLDLSWEAVSGSDVSGRHNAGGSHYHACEKCVGSQEPAAIVYISPQGDSYHNSASCSGLTRHVHLVKQSEVSGKQICSRCAAKHPEESAD